MKIGVIGYSGVVGSALLRLGYEPIKCNVTDPIDLRVVIKPKEYDAIIYAAGMTNVDECEKDYKSAVKVNAWGINNLVDFYQGRVIYISTDHIFNGRKFLGSGYTESHSPDPINIYGRTKLAGEWVSDKGVSDAKIIRTSKLFNRKYATNAFNMWEKTIPLEFTNVIKRSFLHVNHFADGIQFVLENWEKIPRILNISGTSIMSHYMFFSAVARKLGIDETLLKPRNHYDKTLTPRPKRGGLYVGLAKNLGVPLYSAYEGIALL